MKTKQFLFTSTLLIVVTLMSCKKDKNDSNNNNGGNTDVSYTIDGGSFKNQLITFNSTPKAMTSGADASKGYLLVYIDDALSEDTDAPHTLVLSFNKAGTGTAKVGESIPNATGDDEWAVVAFGLDIPSTPHVGLSQVDPKDTPGTVAITKFGKIGEPVEGTFEGTVVDGANVKYKISGGHFKITRKG